MHWWHEGEGWGPPWARVISGRRRGWLRPIILRLLLARPMNGIEIIEEIERLTGGAWRPSPGSVYPMLADLLREGVIARRQDGRYELTEAGRSLAQAVMPLPPDPIALLNIALDELERLARSSPDLVRPRLAQLRELRERLERLERELS